MAKAFGSPPSPLPSPHCPWRTKGRPISGSDQLPDWVVEDGFAAVLHGWTALKIKALFMHPKSREWWICTIYGSDVEETASHYCQVRPLRCFRPVRETDENHFKAEEKEEPVMSGPKLYTWKDGEKEVFGTRIGTNSEGMAVMEVKGGSGAPVVCDPKTIEIVLPYTISANRVGDEFQGHWKVVKGSVAVGDIVVSNDGYMLQISKLDTKAEKNKGWLKGTKLVGELLLGHED